MGSSNAKISAVLEAIATAGKAWSQQKPGAREELLTLAHSLTTALETPSEAVQRIGWAEVCLQLFEWICWGPFWHCCLLIRGRKVLACRVCRDSNGGRPEIIREAFGE